jgi:hypothetical protein
METRKAAIIEALRNWIAQRPGMDPRNYDMVGYRVESRRITRQKNDALILMRAVELHGSLTADDLLHASECAFSGRLSILPPIQNGCSPTFYRISYCTGQYWPTEYRAAVCAVLASALWAWTRGHAMPKPFKNIGTGDAEWYAFKATPGTLPKPLSAGDWLRAHFAREFGRGIASRWFN